MKTKRSVCKAAAAAVLGFMLTACAGKSLEGKWVEPIPGMEGQVQGVCLEKAVKHVLSTVQLCFMKNGNKKAIRSFFLEKALAMA